MITAKITNIILEQNRFKVFISLSNGLEESYTFMPEIASDTIINWVKERVSYYTDLELQEAKLREELLNKEY